MKEKNGAAGRILKPVAKIKGGAAVPHFKNTKDCESVYLPTPKKVTILMNQHIGAECAPTVKKGDRVKIGDLIGDSTAPISAPVHASVSGTVTEITSVLCANGIRSSAVVIESDGLNESIEQSPKNALTSELFIAEARNSGLVGLGGAGFPAHVKLTPSEQKPLDTLIINAAECEPYITSDYRECIENSWDIMSGIFTVMEQFNIQKAIIAVEDNKPEAIRLLSEIADSKADVGDKVRVMALSAKYPQGAEKVLIYTVTGRKVPQGKLPADVGCLVMNVTSIAFLGRYMKTGMPLTSKRITVDGSAVEKPMNVIVPIGTPISEVLDFCGVDRKNVAKVLMGGPMMGIAIADINAPVVKNNNAILAFDSNDAIPDEETACIRCGKCVAACPMSLMPVSLEKAVKRNDAKYLADGGIMTCMECGSCAFACPAKRKLVQYMRLGKSIVRNGGKK